MQETQATLEQEENKAKQEHRQRLKLEQIIAELEEKLDRETKVVYMYMYSSIHFYCTCMYIVMCVCVCVCVCV